METASIDKIFKFFNKIQISLQIIVKHDPLRFVKNILFNFSPLKFTLLDLILGKRANMCVLVICGQLELLGPFRVLVVRMDICAQPLSGGYRCTTYIYNSTAVHKNSCHNYSLSLVPSVQHGEKVYQTQITPKMDVMLPTSDLLKVQRRDTDRLVAAETREYAEAAIVSTQRRQPTNLEKKRWPCGRQGCGCLCTRAWGLVISVRAIVSQWTCILGRVYQF